MFHGKKSNRKGAEDAKRKSWKFFSAESMHLRFCFESVRAVYIRGHARAAHAFLKFSEVIQVHIAIFVEVTVLTGRVGLRDTGAGVAALEVAKVGLIHIAIVIEIA